MPGARPVPAPWPVLREPVGHGHGEAQETQADAVHLRRDGDVGKESALP